MAGITWACEETARRRPGFVCGSWAGDASLTSWWAGQQTRSAGSNRGADVGSTRIGARNRGSEELGAAALITAGTGRCSSICVVVDGRLEGNT
jgi:hypothetical protein